MLIKPHSTVVADYSWKSVGLITGSNWACYIVEKWLSTNSVVWEVQPFVVVNNSTEVYVRQKTQRSSWSYGAVDESRSTDGQSQKKFDNERHTATSRRDTIPEKLTGSQLSQHGSKNWWFKSQHFHQYYAYTDWKCSNLNHASWLLQAIQTANRHLSAGKAFNADHVCTRVRPRADWENSYNNNNRCTYNAHIVK